MANKTPKPKFNAAKFKELMLYAAEKSRGDDHFGATKLNKILFFSDFLSYGLTGQAITGAAYVRQPNGPVPRQLKPMQAELENAHDVVIVRRKVFNFVQTRLEPLRPANRGLFSAEEIDLIDDVIRNLAASTAKGVSDLSHVRSRAWQIAELGQEIPYAAVFLSARRANRADIDRGKQLARQYGWLEPDTAN
jgi:antitoxin SocA-like protein